MAVLRRAGCACVRARFGVESTQGSDCIDQPLPGGIRVKDGTSARSIPVIEGLGVSSQGLRL